MLRTFLAVSTGVLFAGAWTLASAPAQGRQVDISGHSVSFTCIGQGSPTIVLENGTAGPLSAIEWEHVAPALSQLSQTCYYDRAGYGRSEPGPKPRTSQQTASELHQLLRAADIPPPYILVGHSFGGLTVRVFANTHPTEVNGVVLVESAHEDMTKRLGDVRRQQGLPDTAVFPPPAMLRAAMAGYPWIEAAIDEWSVLDDSLAQVRGSRNALTRTPLIVIARGRPGRYPGVPPDKIKPFDDAWRELQEALTRLSDTGRLIIADRSAHDVPREQPEVIVGAVRQLLEGIRTR